MPGSAAGGGSQHDIVRAVHAYGAAHADEFGSVRWDGDRVIASFTADLDGHLRRLRSLVADPARVEVEPCRYTRAHLELVQQEVRAGYGGPQQHILQQTGRGSVQVRAPFVDVAADLHARYGDALDITVGRKPYPPERIGPREPVPLPSSTENWPNLQIDLELGVRGGPSGQDLRGEAVLVNRGEHRLHFLTSPTVRGGLHADGHRVGVLTGAHTLVGRIVDLRPSETMMLGLLIGTAPCTPDERYTLPAGRYGVVASLHVNPLDDAGRPTKRVHLVYFGPDITLTEPTP